MMTRSLHRLVAAVTLAGFLATVQAMSIIVPDNMTADVPQEIRVNPRIDDRPDLQAKFDVYRVYLSLEPPGWGIGVDCWLAFAEDLDTRFINVTIPAEAVPPNARMRIAAGLMKKGAGSVNGFSYSIKVPFIGGNGTWSQAELNGRSVIGNQDMLSCDAYGCARACSDKFWNGEESGEDAADDCILQCARDLNPTAAAAGAFIPFTSAFVFSIAIALVHIL